MESSDTGDSQAGFALRVVAGNNDNMWLHYTVIVKSEELVQRVLDVDSI